MVKLNTFNSFEDTIKGMISFDFENIFVPEVFSAILVCLFLIIVAFIFYFSVRKADVKKTPKGILLIGCILVEKVENFVSDIMGERNRNFSGYFIGLMGFIFGCFMIGLIGFPSPLTNLTVPLSIGLCTFVLIHVTAIKENKFRYFKRYIEPIPIFLPINLVTMWAPLLSISLRLFGNALAGMCLMSVTYFGLRNLSAAIFGSVFSDTYWINAMEGFVEGSKAMGPAGMFIAPLFTPILHAYFDVFSGAIQTLVFSILTMIWISQEQNEDDPNLVIDKISYHVKEESL